LHLSGDACYLVTGGLSGFGLATARWLAAKGAGALVLLGRSGASTPEAKEAVAGLQAAGVQVQVKKGDVSDAARMEEILAEIDRDLPPLKGIVHAAMVLDDALLTNLDGERLRKVLAPKILGAWHLHNLTKKLPLDLFVLYSSATTFLGNPGQGNYVAANMYLESLAAMRRAAGLPALCVSWGAISDVGYAGAAAADRCRQQCRDRSGVGGATEVPPLGPCTKIRCVTPPRAGAGQ
jgi:NAD(P)-dependent dehydrogenase (short-subunit alcohol dehydrogenase family)